jgi:hypothetical protein
VHRPVTDRQGRAIGGLDASKAAQCHGAYLPQVGACHRSGRTIKLRDSRKVISLLQDWVPTPENTVRWHWGQGDVAMWDSRATQHYAVDD